MSEIKNIVLSFCFSIVYCFKLVAQNQYKHFTIQNISDGVYAAISKPGGYAICNAGIINMGDATLIFDPFMVPEAAQELKTAAESLTGNPVKYVVLSHFHNDHVCGTQVFKDATVISSLVTANLIENKLPGQLDYFKKNAIHELIDLESDNSEIQDTFLVTEKNMWNGYYKALVDAGESIKVITPNQTFKKELLIKGSKKTIRLVTYGEAHTKSDCFLFMPEEKIVFSGDIVFIDHHPWLGDGNTESWKKYLTRLKKLDFKVLIPGHGPIGNKKALSEMHDYFDAVNTQAYKWNTHQITPSPSSLDPLPFKFRNMHLINFYFPNVKGAYDRIKNRE